MSPTCLHQEIVEARWAHPIWSHYALSMVHLRETEGAPPAIKNFKGATHEFVIAALDPKDNQTPLLPLNYIGQFAFRDDIAATAFARALAEQIRERKLHPDTDFLKITAARIEALASIMGSMMSRTAWKHPEDAEP